MYRQETVQLRHTACLFHRDTEVRGLTTTISTIYLLIYPSINQPTNLTTSQPTKLSINQPTNLSINQPTNLSINQPTNLSINQPTNLSINQSINS